MEDEKPKAEGRGQVIDVAEAVDSPENVEEEPENKVKMDDPGNAMEGVPHCAQK